MDQIVGTRPTSSPVNIIESFEESTETTTDESSELNDTEKSSTADNEESGEHLNKLLFVKITNKIILFRTKA